MNEQTRAWIYRVLVAAVPVLIAYGVLDEASGVTVRVGIGKDVTGYGLTTEIVGYLPGLEQAVAEELMSRAAAVCPYSKATRGNVETTLLAKV